MKVTRRSRAWTLIVCTAAFISSPVIAQQGQLNFAGIHKRVLGVETNVSPKAQARTGPPGLRGYRTPAARPGTATASASRSRRGAGKSWVSRTRNSVRVALGYGRQRFTSRKVRRDPFLSSSKAAESYLKKQDVAYKVTRVGNPVGSPVTIEVNPEATTEADAELNQDTLSALEAMSRGDMVAAHEKLKEAAGHPEDAESASEMQEAIQDLNMPMNQLGHVEIRAASENYALWADGQLMDVGVPCSLIAGQGPHTIRVADANGEAYEIRVVVSAGRRTTVDLDLEKSHVTIDDGGNSWYCGRSEAAFSGKVIQDRWNLNPGRVCFSVKAPLGTKYRMRILQDGNVWSDWESNVTCVHRTLLSRSAMTMEIEVREGGGTFWVYFGRGTCRCEN